MKLTICICTYNRSESLKRCIKSINKLINQSSIKISIIIIDNSKNFNVRKIKNQLINISKYKISFLNEKKRGIVNARNKFLKNLKNVIPNFISFFDVNNRRRIARLSWILINILNQFRPKLWQ